MQYTEFTDNFIPETKETCLKVKMTSSKLSSKVKANEMLVKFLDKLIEEIEKLIKAFEVLNEFTEGYLAKIFRDEGEQEYKHFLYNKENVVEPEYEHMFSTREELVTQIYSAVMLLKKMRTVVENYSTSIAFAEGRDEDNKGDFHPE